MNVFNSSAVTIEAKYLHYDLGHETFQNRANVGVGFYARNRVDGDLVRGGLNSKFGSPVVEPVVARY